MPDLVIPTLNHWPQVIPLGSGGGGAGVDWNVVQASSDVAAAFGDLVDGDASGGAFNVTLPATNSVVADGPNAIIVKNEAATGTVTVVPAGGDTIDGVAGSVTLNTREAVYLVSDGVSNWIVVAGPQAGVQPAVPISALYTNGAGQHVNHKLFWAPENQTLTNLMQWEAWAYLNPFSNSNYIISDGYGGAHALLWSGVSGNINFQDGGGAQQIVSFTSPDDPPPGVFSHFMVRLYTDAFANLFILTFINGILSGKNLVPAGYTRSCVPGAAGQGNLYVMGSDHSNATGWMAMLRGWDIACGFDGAVELGTAFIPNRVFAALNQLYGPIDSDLPVPADFLCSYLQPAGAVVYPDLSYGYDTNGAWPARTQHPGYAAGGNDTYPNLPFVYPMPSPRVIPSPQTTAPFYFGYTNVPPDRGYTPRTPPVRAKRYDSFSRPDQTYAHVLVPTLGSTESGSLGAAVWQSRDALGGSITFPSAVQLFNRSARVGTEGPVVLWIPNASDSADMIVTSDRVDPTLGCDGLTTVAARVADDGSSCFYAFYQYLVGAQSIVYLYRMDAPNVFTLVDQATVPHTGWTTLKLECVGATINVYTDLTQVISATDANFATQKGAGAFFQSNPSSTGEAVLNWTVY